MDYGLGVDLGTTFVAAATAHAGRVEMLTLGERTVVAPSVVYVRDDGVVLTGDAAVRRAGSEPQRAAAEFKRRLGDPIPLRLGDAAFSPTALLGQQLADVLDTAAEKFGNPPCQVVLTQPANWGPYRRELFAEVPRLTGLDSVRMVTEPEAAAAYYASTRHLNDGDVVAVYDLGGGTFDAAVVRKQPDGFSILGAPEGIERLGGVDFDEAVLRHVDFALDGALTKLSPQDPRTAVALHKLHQDCIAAKEALSADTETTIPVLLPDRHDEVKLTRNEFEAMVRASIETTIEALRRALRSAEVEPSELAAVLLVGGSSRIPLVARMVSEALGRPITVDTHPKYAVALGAAMLTEAAGSTRDLSADAVPAAAAHDDSPPSEDSASGTPPPPPTRSGDRRSRRKAVVLGATGVVAAVGLGIALGLPDSGDRPPRPTIPAPAQPLPPATLGVSTPTPQVIANIDVAAPRSIAITPDGRTAYVTSKASGTISVIDTTTNRVVASLKPAETPQFVTVSADGRSAYISCFSAPGQQNTVLVLDTATNNITGTISAGRQPYELAPSPDGQEIYVPDHGSAALAVVATGTQSVVGTLGIKPNPHSAAITPSGDTAYVPSHESDVVSVVDTATRNVTAEVSMPKSPHGSAMAPDGSTVLITSMDAETASFINTRSNTVAATVPVGMMPSMPAFAADGRHAYVVNERSNSLTVIDTSTYQVTATVPLGAAPFAIAVTPDGRRAYVTNTDSDTVDVLSTAD